MIYFVSKIVHSVRNKDVCKYIKDVEDSNRWLYMYGPAVMHKTRLDIGQAVLR